VPRDERFDRTGQVHGHERYCRAGRARPPEGDSRHSDRTVRRRDSRPTAGPHRRARARRPRSAMRSGTRRSSPACPSRWTCSTRPRTSPSSPVRTRGPATSPRETRGTRRRGDERFGRPRAEHRRARAGVDFALHPTVPRRRAPARVVASGDITGGARTAGIDGHRRRTEARSDGRSVTGSSRSASRRSAFATRPRRAARPTR